MNFNMSEELMNTIQETQPVKETKRPRGKKANVEQPVEEQVEQIVEQVEEAIVEEVVETEIEVEAEVEVEEQIVEPAPQQTEQVVEQPKEIVVEQPKTETFDLRTIKREAIRYNHCVFTYSDGFICHAVSRAKADAKHNAWLNRK
jgi:outer membrane biosynthesis protein TonB